MQRRRAPPKQVARLTPFGRYVSAKRAPYVPSRVPRPFPAALARAAFPNELNYLDTAPAMEVFSTGSTLLLNGLTLGTTATTRLGQRIIMRSLQLHLEVRPDTAALQNTFRIVIVYDSQANGAAPTWNGASTSVYASASPAALRLVENQSRFKVLMDTGQVSQVGNVTTAGQGTDNSTWTCDRYLKLNLPVTYNTGNAGTVADIQTGSLYLLQIGNRATGTGSAELSGNIRLRFQA